MKVPRQLLSAVLVLAAFAASAPARAETPAQARAEEALAIFPIDPSAPALPLPRELGQGHAIPARSAASPRPAAAPASDDVGTVERQARRFAATKKLNAQDTASLVSSLVAHSAGRNILNRYVWAYAQFNLKNPQGRVEALKLAEQIADFPSEKYALFSDAFHFAYAEDDMDLPLDQAQEFATASLRVRKDQFNRYRLAYRNAMTDGVLGRNGIRKNMARQYARMVAESIAKKSDSAPERYRFAFMTLPAENDSDFAKALGFAEQLAALSPRQYADFSRGYRASRRRSHLSSSQAVTLERKKRGMQIVVSPILLRGKRPSATTGQMPARNDAPSLALRPARELEALADPDPSELVLSHAAEAVPGLGCENTSALSVRDFAKGIPGFDKILQAVQVYNMNHSVPYAENMRATKYRQVLRAASEAFGIPERALYCSYSQESRFNPKAHSGAEAYGIAQITPVAFTEINRITHLRVGPAPASTGATAAAADAPTAGPPETAVDELDLPTRVDLKRRWDAYVGYMKKLGNPVPNGDRSLKSVGRDPIWSIGAGALFTKLYERDFVGNQKRMLDVDSYAMIIGAYNKGMPTFKQICHPTATESDKTPYESCQAARLPDETKHHMDVVRACLAKP